MPKLLTVSEVADVFRLHPNTLYNLIDRGDLPVVRIGGTVRIREDVVAALLDAGAPHVTAESVAAAE